MKKLLALCSLACTLALPLSASAQEDYPPGEVRLAPTIDLDLQSVPIEGMPGRTLNLPPGFKVKLFSDQVNKARFMAFDDNGVLHLTNMHTNGSNQWSPDPNRTSDVLAFLDFDNDGHADSVYVAANDFLWPHSIAFYKGQLYVADHDIIYRLTDNDGDGFYEERENFIEVPGIMGRASEHITHTLVFDEENEKLYLHAGSGCDLCREDDPERATILEFNADGTGRRIYASGLRNAIGLDLHPVTGELWAAGNGHDREGAALPPEWINVIPENSFHGWPLAFGYQKWVDFSISRYRSEIFPLTAQDSALVASIRRPVALVPAHLAPMGLHFYTHDQFPPQYKNAAFVAFRAGVLGNDPGYKVSVLFSEPDGSNARIGDFLTGFRPNPQTNDFWGTPVGLITDDKGFLYLTSDRFTQAIFRIEAVPGPDNPTAVEEASQNSAPASFALEANYPNPFNASTTLRYRLDAAGPVRIDIYSLDGQKVRTLVDQSQQAGTYSTVWNGKDANGRSVASGVYLARLEGMGAAQVHKMLLLK
jgi:glucose/arabinose dehydrogenase